MKHLITARRTNKPPLFRLYARWWREFRAAYRIGDEEVDPTISESRAAILFGHMLSMYKFFIATAITLFSAYVALIAFALEVGVPNSPSGGLPALRLVCLTVGIILTIIYGLGFFASLDFMNTLRFVSLRAKFGFAPSGHVFVGLVAACFSGLSLMCLILIAFSISGLRAHPFLSFITHAQRQTTSVEVLLPRLPEFSERQAEWMADNCPGGMPMKYDYQDHGTTEYVVRPQYALEQSCSMRIPLWVCEHITADELSPAVAHRRDPFRHDPLLSANCRSELADYKESEYDRGHMAPANNQRSSQAANDETFFLSNMAPQVGVRFNRHLWKKLEEHATGLVTRNEHPSVWAITGPMFLDPAEKSPITADGMITRHRIGRNLVAIPTHFYKIIAVRVDGEWQAAGYVMKNEEHIQTTGPFDEFARPIEWIEQNTGLDFFSEYEPTTFGMASSESVEVN